MSETVISIKDVRKSYGPHVVLNGVDLDIYKGDIFGLVGKNGAGKTTLFKLVLGLSAFEKGTITINGQKHGSARDNMGFMVGSNLFGYMDARQNLKYYCDMKGIRNAKSEIDRVLDIVGLKDVKTKVKGYSLGMRQRLGIANALLGNPSILILDEPTNGLDPQGIVDVRNMVQKLNHDTGMTIIISSHNLGELQHTAHRFGIVDNGRIMKTITQEELQNVDLKKNLAISTEDIERAKEILTREGISFTEAAGSAVSLEDFYFKMIGGEEKNA